MNESDDFETRLRSYLKRTANMSVSSTLEKNLSHISDPKTQPMRWNRSSQVALLITFALIVGGLMLVLFSGHQVNNLFTNVSSGLGQ